jgi:tetratricopeptide (TPR) repeat protein
LARARSGRELDAAGVSRWWLGQGLRWWREEPGEALGLTVRKLLLLWGPHEISDVLSREIASRWVLFLRNPLLSARWLLPLALLGLILSWRQDEAWILRAYLLAAQLALLPFFLFERFRLPMLAVSTLLAARALVWIYDGIRARRWSAILRSSLLLAGLGMVLALPKVSRDETVLRVNVGSLYLSAGRYAEALREFDAVRREQPNAWRVEMNIAATYAAMGRSSDALLSLERVLERLYAEGRATGRPVQQEIVQCHELAGDLLARQGRFREAQAQFEAALKVGGEQPRLRAKRDRAAQLAEGLSPGPDSP